MKINFLKSKFDRFVVAVATVSAGVSGYLSVDDSILFKFANSELAQLEPVAQVKNVQQDVRRRLPFDFSWFPLQNDVQVYNGDTIFTGADSNADIVLNDGTVLSLDQKSLVVIKTQPNGSPIIDIQSGTVVSDLPESSEKRVELKVRGKPVQIKGRNANLKLNVKKGSKTQIAVLKGQVEIQNGDKVETLQTGQNLKLTPGTQNIEKASSVSIETLPPKYSKSADQKTYDYNFTWSEVGQVKTYKVLISQDSTFKNVDIETSVTNPKAVFNDLSEQTSYYWKVVGLDQNGAQFVESNTSRFKTKAMAPATTLPFQNYAQQIQKMETIKIPPNDAQSKAEGNKTQETAPPVVENKTEPKPENKAETKVEAKPEPTAKKETPIKLIFPAQNSKVALKLKPRSKREMANVYEDQTQVSFEWRKPGYEGAYELQVSSSENFDKLFAFKKTNKNTAKIENLKKGEYFWRVRTQDGQTSAWSEVSRFNVAPQNLEAAPNILSPQAKETLAITESKNIQFLWEAPYIAKGYEIIISSSPKFDKKSILLNQKVTEGQYTWTKPRSGTFYWKVRAIINDNETSEFSSSCQFRIKGNIKLPAPKIEQKVKEFEVQLELNKPQWFEHLLQIFVSVANASENSEKKPGPVLQWPTVAGATYYEVEISKDPSFKNPILKTKAKQNSFQWNSFKPGIYHWRVAGKDGEGQVGEWSESAVLKILVAPPPPKPDQLVEFEVKTDADLSVPPPPVPLSWQKSQFANQYELQFSENSEFSGAIDSRVARKNELEFKMAEFGKRYWRVRALDKDKTPMGRFSKARILETRQKFNLTAPENLAPSDTSVFLHGENINNLPLKWDAVPIAEKYVVETSTKENFAELAETSTSSQPDFKATKNIIAGNLYWRVKAVRGASESPWAQGFVFIVKRAKMLESPLGLSPSSNKSFISGADSASTVLSWQPVKSAKSYVLEIADNPALLNPLQTLYTANTSEAVSLPPGNYHWKVTSAETLPRGLASIMEGMVKIGKPSDANQLIVKAGEDKNYGVSLNLSTPAIQQSGTGSSGLSGSGTGTMGIGLKAEGTWWWESNGLYVDGQYQSLSYSFTPNGSSAQSLKATRMAANVRGQYRYLMKNNLSLIGGLGLRYDPSLFAASSGGTVSFSQVNPVKLNEHLEFRFDPNFGQYSIGALIDVTQPINNLNSMSFSPGVDFKYRMNRYWFGGEFTSFSDVAKQTNGTATVTEIRFLLKAGIWD